MPHFQAACQEKSVIPFLMKTWLLWWMLADVVILRWLHVLFARGKMSALNASDAGEEQTYIRSWRLLRRSHAISLRFIRD